MKLPKHAYTIALVSLMGVAAPVAVMAQAQQTPPSSSEDVSNDEIDAFVAAYGNVKSIEDKYRGQMEQATDQDEMQGLQQEAQLEMAEAVEATPNIDAERYVEILTIAQADTELRTKIMEKIER